MHHGPDLSKSGDWKWANKWVLSEWMSESVSMKLFMNITTATINMILLSLSYITTYDIIHLYIWFACATLHINIPCYFTMQDRIVVCDCHLNAPLLLFYYTITPLIVVSAIITYGAFITCTYTCLMYCSLLSLHTVTLPTMHKSLYMFIHVLLVVSGLLTEFTLSILVWNIV